MATNYYVTKSGNDSNNGLTIQTAKLTVGGGMAAFAAGAVDGIINVYRGVYKESVTMTRNFDATLEVNAIGHVIVDGENVRSFGLDFGFPSNGNGSLNSTYRGFEVINCTDTGIRHRGNNLGASTTQAGKVRNCVVHNCPKGVSYPFGSGAPGGADVQDSVFFDCSVAGVWGGSPEANYTIAFIVKNNTFYNCLTGAEFTSTNMSLSEYNNIYVNCTTGIALPTTTLGANQFERLDYDDFFSCTYVGKLTTNTYATKALFAAAIIAGWNNQYGPYTDAIETHGLEVDPLFVDGPKHLFGLRLTSPLIGTGLNGADIGAKGVIGFAGSNTYNSGQWSGGVFVDTQLNGSNNIELIPPAVTGTWTSVVQDLGNAQTFRLTGVDLGATENYPTDVLDTDITDVPNREHIEVRMSNGIFTQNAAQPDWTLVEVGADAPVTLTGRFIQTRITLRNNGIAT